MRRQSRSGKGRSGRTVEKLEERRLLATFVVTNVEDAGAGSLRQAILGANASAGADVIAFAIPGEGVQTIGLASALPTIEEPVTIDGYTQPGARPNTLAVGDDAVLKISLGANELAINERPYDAFGPYVIRGLVLGSVLVSYTYNVVVEGSFIGVDSGGVARLGTGRVRFVNESSERIGGADPASRNIIAGGISTYDMGGPVIQNNYIGVDASGTRSLGNAGWGISILATGAQISGNVISGNGLGGIRIGSEDSHVSAIEGNLIGTDASGERPLGNGGPGIDLSMSYAPISGNTIAFNQNAGIQLGAGTTYKSRARILGNRIYGNGGLPIAFGYGGIVPNDPLDRPSALGDYGWGPNAAANRPVLLSAETDGGRTIIRGVINTRPSSSTEVELFSSDTADVIGNGQGQRIIGRTTVVTDVSGNGSFTVTVPGMDLVGQLISATSTAAGAYTSQFSLPIAVGTRREGPVLSSFGIISPYNQYDGITFAWGRATQVQVMGTWGDLGTGVRLVRVDWGDGTPPSDTKVQAEDGVFVLDHAYAAYALPGALRAWIKDGNGAGDIAISSGRWASLGTSVKADQPYARPGTEIALTGSFYRRTAQDPYQVKWDFGDGSVTEWMDASTPDVLSVRHVYSAMGTYQARLWVREVGGVVGGGAANVYIREPGVGPSPWQMVFWGTNGDDQIRISQEGDHILFSCNGVVTAHSLQGATVITVYGYRGNDLIVNDVPLIAQLYGDEGDDTLWGGSAGDWVSGGQGDDEAYGRGGADSLQGEAGNDALYGGDGNDEIEGGDGDDTIGGNFGNDRLYGGEGRNSIMGGLGDDEIHGGSMAETILGGDGKDYIDARGGDDLIEGKGKADTLIGGEGNDTIIGGAGADVVYGGYGDDSIEGNAGQDVLFGDDGNDTILGGSGGSSLYGGAGDDSLVGMAGNDLLEGGEGADTLSGGDGNDTLYGHDGGDLLLGGPGDDELYGNRGWDTLYGGPGNDYLTGNAGRNWVYGESGNDTLRSNGGMDYLSGGSGTNVLQPDGGDDVLERVEVGILQ